MGGAASTGPASPETIRVLLDPAGAFKASRGKIVPEGEEMPGGDALAAYNILGGQHDRVEAAAQVIKRLAAVNGKAAKKKKKATDDGGASAADEQALDRSLGCLLGNAVGDALGAPLEFSNVRYGVQELQGMCQEEIWTKTGYNRFSLKPGQWTDDASMALCIADSLLCCDGFDALDLRQRFYLWNRHGYNNAFGRDPERNGRSSVGLGGNISESMDEWERESTHTKQTKAGTQFTSGNGSVMRNGALPVWFRNDLEMGMDAAYQQSKTTHGGDEAAELCRLLTWLCGKFIGGASRWLLDDLSDFQTPLYNVECLANGICEKKHEHNSNRVFGGLENRRWDWRSENHRYCKMRAEEQPDYIGSYAMDAMSMALHCVYTTRSFEEATLKVANMCGDSDSVCAVVGQIAGAMYGASAIPVDWLDRVQRWDGGTIAAKALMLHNREALPPTAALSDEACATAGLLGKAWESAEEAAKA